MTPYAQGYLGCAILVAAAVAGCANPREDVRVTLCKDMAAVELGAVPSWQGSEIRIRGRQGAAVTVRFEGGQEATCDYKYDAVEDTALTLANPIEAYATSPSKMTINGRIITDAALARTIGRAMQKQGRDFVDRARAAVKGQ
jgi:hypothetical protein